MVTVQAGAKGTAVQDVPLSCNQKPIPIISNAAIFANNEALNSEHNNS